MTYNRIRIEGGWCWVHNRDKTILECKESFSSKGRIYCEDQSLKLLRQRVKGYGCIQGTGGGRFLRSDSTLCRTTWDCISRGSISGYEDVWEENKQHEDGYNCTDKLHNLYLLFTHYCLGRFSERVWTVRWCRGLHILGSWECVWTFS